MHSYEDIGEGEIYGEWVVVGGVFRQTRKIDGVVEWFAPCQCKCGNYRAVRVAQLKNGHSTSCGWCEGIVADGQRLYTIWRGMIMRCTRPEHKHYASYGGRGIRISEEWASNFKAFKAWSLANGYAAKLQIDRINNDGDYNPDNCRWVSGIENSRNKRTNVMLSAFGETKCLMDWVNDPRCSITFSTLRGRIQRGMSVEEAITAKPMVRNERKWSAKMITIQGETKNIMDWTKDPRCTIGRLAIAKRLKKGMSPEEAVFGRTRRARTH